MVGMVEGTAVVPASVGTTLPLVGALTPVADVVVGLAALSLLQAAINESGINRRIARRNDMSVSFAIRGRVVASAQRATVALRETRGAPLTVMRAPSI
jgi:hypothetical protein